MFNFTGNILSYGNTWERVQHFCGISTFEIEDALICIELLLFKSNEQICIILLRIRIRFTCRVIYSNISFIANQFVDLEITYLWYMLLCALPTI